MRCYFMRDGHIDGVAIMENIKDDNSAIKRGAELFLSRLSRNYDGFEIWDRDRMVYRYPEVQGQNGGSASGSGNPSIKPDNGGLKNSPRLPLTGAFLERQPTIRVGRFCNSPF